VAKDTLAKLPTNSQFAAVRGANPALLSPIIASLFPEGVFAAELRAAGEVSLLDPAEAAAVLNAVPKRVQEFAAGRLCAHRVLAELGVIEVPVLSASDRRPLWPVGMVGSITHTAGFCAAVAAERSRFVSLGLDTEVARAVKAELWPRICIASELAWVASLEPAGRARAVALIFSAKEAFFKCQYPIAQERLHFADLEVVSPDWGSSSGSITAAPLRPMSVPAVQGAFRFHEEFVSTGVYLRST
jgi:4'-phosphopantetheinyl transferase EntD